MPYLGTIAEAFGPPGKRPYCVFVTQEEDLHTVQTRLEAFDSIPDQRDSPLRWADGPSIAPVLQAMGSVASMKDHYEYVGS